MTRESFEPNVAKVTGLSEHYFCGLSEALMGWGGGDVVQCGVVGKGGWGWGGLGCGGGWGDTCLVKQSALPEPTCSKIFVIDAEDTCVQPAATAASSTLLGGPAITYETVPFTRRTSTGRSQKPEAVYLVTEHGLHNLLVVCLENTFEVLVWGFPASTSFRMEPGVV